MSRTLVVAWAEAVRGSGYNNRIIWRLWRHVDGRFEVDALQVEEQTEQMRVLHKVASAATEELTGWVKAMESEKRRSVSS
jgi:hypothetical protein